MRRKVFIGIDLDGHVKQMLAKTTKKWQNLPIKWHKTDGLHIALFSIGWVNEDDVFDISDAIRSVTAETESFVLEFDKITTKSKKSESDNIKNAQIVRLEGKPSEELKNLFEQIQKALKLPTVKKKNFKPIVTLGRMRAKAWQELKEFPEIETRFPVIMDVFGVTLFESVNIEGEWQIVPIDVFELE